MGIFVSGLVFPTRALLLMISRLMNVAIGASRSKEIFPLCVWKQWMWFGIYSSLARGLETLYRLRGYQRREQTTAEIPACVCERWEKNAKISSQGHFLWTAMQRRHRAICATAEALKCTFVWLAEREKRKRNQFYRQLHAPDTRVDYSVGPNHVPNHFIQWDGKCCWKVVVEAFWFRK